MTALAIPTSPEAITPEWLTNALHAGGHILHGTVTSLQCERVGQGIGVLGRLYRLTPTYDPPATNGPRTLVAKITTDDPNARALVMGFHFYEREVRFYQELAGDVGISVPEAYYCTFDAATGDFVLLLEDLTGARLGDQVAGASDADVRVVMEELGKLHARWWNAPRLATLDWMPESNSPLNKAGLAPYPQAYPIFLDRFGHALPEGMARIGERLGPEINGILDRFSSGDKTLLHADSRLDNLFFATRPGDPPLTMVDWQISNRGHGAYDVGYFITQSVEPELRQRHEREWLALYHQTLLQGGVSNFSLDDLVDQFRWAALFCFVYPVMGGAFGDLANERGLALFTATTRRSSAAILDWNAGELIGA
jgi:hypothetical protein